MSLGTEICARPEGWAALGFMAIWAAAPAWAGGAPPTINVTEPAADMAASGFALVRWTDSDDSDNAQIRLFYTPEQSATGTEITAAPINEDPDGAADFYIWDTSNTAFGVYYVYAVIDDGTNAPVKAFAPGRVTVTNGLPKFVINELRINETPASGGNFAEIAATAAGFNLDRFSLRGADGATGQVYATLALSGQLPANGRGVVSAGAALPGRFQTSALVNFEKGPDSVQLWYGAAKLDAVGYGNFAAAVFAGEGSAVAAPSAGFVLARQPDATDTGQNSADFRVTSQATPGAPNPLPNTAPSLNFQAPVVAEAADQSYLIKFQASDPTDAITVDLFHDTDDKNFDGTAIVSSLNGATVTSYVWNTSALAQGLYRVYAKVADGINPPLWQYAPGTVVVLHAPPVDGGVPDSGLDGGVDSGIADAGLDAGADGGLDAGPDGGVQDGGGTTTPNVVINEIYYDPPGDDAASGLAFIELFGPPGTPLQGMVLEAFEGDAAAPYAAIALNGQTLSTSGYFVVGGANVAGAQLVDAAADLRNGPTSLVLKTGPTPADAVGYGAFTAGGFRGEGQVSDGAPEGKALARIPNGADTGDNAADFTAVPLPTPGSANTTAPPTDGGFPPVVDSGVPEDGGADPLDAGEPDGGTTGGGDAAITDAGIDAGVDAGVTLDAGEFTGPRVRINEFLTTPSSGEFQPFIELHGPPGTPLTGFQVVGISALTGKPYMTITLTSAHTIGPSGFFVLSSSPLLPRVDLVTSFAMLAAGPASVQITYQDHIADAVGYGDFTTGIFAGEGSPAESPGPDESCGRRKDGEDSDFNSLDFIIWPFPTPGRPNGTLPATPDAGEDGGEEDDGGAADGDGAVSTGNTTPSLVFTAPFGDDNTADMDFLLAWDAEDPDDNARIDLYYEPADTVIREAPAGTRINGFALREGPDTHSTGTHRWVTASVPGGRYAVYAIIADPVNPPVIAWADGTIQVVHDAGGSGDGGSKPPGNTPPELAFAPVEGTTITVSGAHFIAWSAYDPDDDALIALDAVDIYGRSYLIAGEISEDANPGGYLWLTELMPVGKYRLRATIGDGHAREITVDAPYVAQVVRAAPPPTDAGGAADAPPPSDDAGDAGTEPAQPADTGCNCRATPAESGAPWWFALSALAVLWRRKRGPR